MISKDWVKYVNNNYNSIRKPGIFRTTNLYGFNEMGGLMKDRHCPTPPHVSLVETSESGDYMNCLYRGHGQWKIPTHVLDIIDIGLPVCMTISKTNFGTVSCGDEIVENFDMETQFGTDPEKLKDFLKSNSSNACEGRVIKIGARK